MISTFLTSKATASPRVGSFRDRAGIGGTESGTEGGAEFCSNGERVGKL